MKGKPEGFFFFYWGLIPFKTCVLRITFLLDWDLCAKQGFVLKPLWDVLLLLSSDPTESGGAGGYKDLGTQLSPGIFQTE